VIYNIYHSIKEKVIWRKVDYLQRKPNYKKFD